MGAARALSNSTKGNLGLSYSDGRKALAAMVARLLLKSPTDIRFCPFLVSPGHQMNRYLIVANWKMNLLREPAVAFCHKLAEQVLSVPHVSQDIVICPQAPLIDAVISAVGETSIFVGAQDCHWQLNGPFTGDVSPVLLSELGCKYVIIGHSERRANHDETDADIRRKAEALLEEGVIPIVCVGETAKQRDDGQTADVIARQIVKSVPDFASSNNIVIAYEPLWAIGTGQTPTLEAIQAAHDAVRDAFSIATGQKADSLRILYGGSVKAANAASIFSIRGVNGALVGGASLDVDQFWQIIESCA